jgi:hypothetical protein
MPSTALETWRGDRQQRLNELFAAHHSVGGTGPGRYGRCSKRVPRSTAVVWPSMVRSAMPHQPAPAAGDRVGVPWGLDVLEGVVLRTYETGSGARAVVSVDVPGAEGEPEAHTMTLPATDLQPIDDGEELQAPGSWVNEYQFAKAVQEALTKAVRRIAERAEVETEPRFGHMRPDAIITLGDHIIVVEAKTTARTAATVDQLDSYLREVRDHNPGASVGGLLVLQFEPQAQVAQELHEHGLTPVFWNTPRDDTKITMTLSHLLEAA